jgi:hypothetical protein
MVYSRCNSTYIWRDRLICLLSPCTIIGAPLEIYMMSCIYKINSYNIFSDSETKIRLQQTLKLDLQVYRLTLISVKFGHQSNERVRSRLPMVISSRVASSSHAPLWPFPHAGGPIPLTLENGGVISVVHKEGGDDGTEKAPPLDP